jgi:hypothetical protein
VIYVGSPESYSGIPPSPMANPGDAWTRAEQGNASGGRLRRISVKG